MRLKHVVLAAVAASAFSLVGAPIVAANDTNCVGLATGVYNNVVVPEGATCTLLNATVNGNVRALTGSSLVILDSFVQGNVQGDQARQVYMNFFTRVLGHFEVNAGPTSVSGITGFDNRVSIGGNVLIEGNRGETYVKDSTVGGNLQVLKSTGQVTIWSITVGGNLHVEENTPTLTMGVESNVVAGSMKVFKTSGPADKFVFGNIVAKDLKCIDNDAPFLGGPNTARKAKGQCF
jgi:hypothetical protein